MTPAQIDAVMRFSAGRASREDLVAQFGVDFQRDPSHTVRILEAETVGRHLAGLEVALLLSEHVGVTEAHVPILRDLVTQLWHTQHENVARLLEALSHPSSIEELFVAASHTYKELPYLEYNDGHAFARKCVWALAKIDTPESWQKLARLAESEDPEVKGFARKRIENRKAKPA